MRCICYSPTEPQVLVEKAKAGDREAFAELYRQGHDVVYHFLYRRVRNKVLAEDLTSQTFLKALTYIGSFTWRGTAFNAWLTTIARNTWKDHVKSGAAQREWSVADLLDLDTESPGVEDEVLRQEARDKAHALIHAGMARLTKPQQQCLRMRFLRELSVAETATAMGLNEGAVKTLQWRAMRRLPRIIPTLEGAT